MTDCGKTLIDDLSRQNIILLIDPALGERGGGKALRSLPILQTSGYTNFSYFDSWRPRYTNNQTLPSSLMGYTYVSLARTDYDRILDIDNLAYFTRQSAEDDIFRGSGPIHYHLRTNKPDHICLVAENEDFSLYDSAGRTIAEEPWFCKRGTMIHHEELVREAVSLIQELTRTDMRFCTSWAQCSIALAVSLVSNIEPRNQKELLDSILDAPYLSIWSDMSLMSPYRDERPDWLRYPVDKPWLVLSRHYGFDTRVLESLWYEVEKDYDRYLNPYTRSKTVMKDYEGKIGRVKNATRNNGFVSRMLRQSVTCGEL